MSSGHGHACVSHPLPVLPGNPLCCPSISAVPGPPTPVGGWPKSATPTKTDCSTSKLCPGLVRLAHGLVATVRALVFLCALESLGPRMCLEYLVYTVKLAILFILSGDCSYTRGWLSSQSEGWDASLSQVVAEPSLFSRRRWHLYTQP